MTIIEQDYAQYYANIPQNYLMDFCRRTNNMANIASYFVESRIDGSTGREIFYIHPIADLVSTPSTDAANPLPIDPAPGDPAVTAETTILT